MKTTNREKMLTQISQIPNTHELTVLAIAKLLNLSSKKDIQYLNQLLINNNIAYLRQKTVRENDKKIYLDKIFQLDNIETLSLDKIKELTNYPKSIASLKSLLILSNISYHASTLIEKRNKK